MQKGFVRLFFAMLLGTSFILSVSTPVASTGVDLEILAENMPYGESRGSFSSFTNMIGVDLNQRGGPDIQGLTLAKELGATTVRTDFFRWHAFEGEPGVFDFTVGDTIIENHENLELKTILNLAGGNFNHTGYWNKPPITDEELQHFSNYLSAIADHYKYRSLYYEIFAEPTIGTWDPPLTAVQFANVVQVATNAIKSKDPSAIVISGGLYTKDIQYVYDFLSFEGFKDVDYFGTHMYLGNPEDLSGHITNFNIQFESLGMPTPTYWDTEWGFSVFEDNFNGQAKRVVRQYLNGWMNGYKNLTTWRFIDDDYYTTGLLTVDYEKKQSFHSLKLLKEKINGRLLIGEIENLPDTTYGLRADGPNDVMYILWATSNPTLTFSVPVGSKGTDFLGNPISMVDNGDSLMYTLTMTNSPVYIECPACITLLESIFLPMISK